MDADTAIPAVMPQIDGTVELPMSHEIRDAVLRRNGQIAYRTKTGGRWIVAAPATASTFQLDEAGQSEYLADETAAHAEAAERDLWTPQDATTVTFTGAELNLIVTALAEMHAKANEWEGQYGPEETAAYYTAPAPVQALMTKIANA